MLKSTRWYQALDDLFEQAAVFNLYQTLVDGGKGRQIRRFLADVPYQSVVDIGCGTGNWVEVARGSYLGVDTSPAFIEACRRRYGHRPDCRFVQADAATLEEEGRFDLALLVSVLHHLPDEAVHRLVPWIVRHAHFFFILDLYPIPWHPLSRCLYALDRGNFIRTPEAQKELLLQHPDLHLLREDSYYCPNGLYRHTLFLFETRRMTQE